MAERTQKPWVLFTAAVLTWLALAVALCIGVPRFEAMFTDFGVALPRLTVWYMNVSRWLLGNHPGMSVPGLVVVFVPAMQVLIGLTALLWFPPTRRYGRMVAWLLFVLGAVLLLVLIASMVIPLVAMQRSMSGL